MLPKIHAPLLTVLLTALAAACVPAAEEGAEPTEPQGETNAAAAAEPAPHPDDPFASDFAAPIEAAHGAGAWHSQQAVAADMTLEFGGNRLFEGTLTFTPDTGGTRIESADGTVMVWDGETAWVSPAEAQVQPPPRFHVLTWPYFFAAPFKLRDPGTRLEDLGELPLDGTPHPAARLSFEEGVGDTPDDWYVVYRDAESDRLAAMAYIVTFGTSQEDAEAEPHAITYEEWSEVDGVAVPTLWNFWLWNQEQGIYGDPIGKVELSDVRFVTPEPGAFTAPDAAAESALPPPAAPGAAAE